MRGGAVAARRAHNPKVLGSNPSPATKRQLHIVGLLKNGKPGDLRLRLSSSMNRKAGIRPTIARGVRPAAWRRLASD